MPSWGRAGANLRLAADGKTVLAAIVHSAGQVGPDSSGTLVGVDPANKTITLQGDHGLLTTYTLAPSATITLDGDAAELGKLPISVWSAEFAANNTATVIRSVSIIAIVVAGLLSLAALLAMRKPGVTSVMWIRHLLIGGYVLFGLYLFGGARIINLIQEKNLMVQLGDAQVPAGAAPTAPAAPSAPPTTAPTTQNVKAPPAVTPAHTPPGGVSVPVPSMRTEGIDLDTPATKPAATASDTPATKPATATPELGPAQPSVPLQTASATTQPTTRSASSDPTPGPPKSVETTAVAEEPEPDFLANQYLLYLRTPWNLVGTVAVFVLAALVILAHITAWDLARAAAVVTQGAHASIGRQDTAYHSNLDSSIVVHVLIILIIPLLLQLHAPNHWARGALDFSMAGGGGSSEPIQVKIVKKKPQKKVKKYVFRKNSAVSFYVPKMDTDSHVLEMADAQTMQQYTATSGTGGSGHGHGRGKGNGHGSGWGNGTGKVRFYHLQYSGANTDWNDGFTDGKDANLLTEWENRERKEGSDLPFGGVVVLSPSQLRPDSHGLLPAFVFITGNPNAMSAHETDQIRQYILKGGMIFADPQYNWQASFLNWCRRLFPDERLIPLDNSEDDIYTSRYTFTVPPQFWSGNRSYLGLKHGDRWVIICDRGRMADGWKSPINEDCIKMGINIVDYAHAHMMTK